jgi:lipopolysaccharide export system permease protein
VLIFRYLAKEVFITLVSLTSLLLLIFMSNQFVQYLNRATNGQIPGMIVMKLMMLELPTLVGLIIPLGFFVAILLAYGRLYADSEMTVLQACGYGSSQLLKHSMIMALGVAIIVAIIMLWMSPTIATERTKLLRTVGVQTLVQTISSGRFRSLSNGPVFYVESMNRSHSKAHNVFVARQVVKDNKFQWDVIWANKAFAETNNKTKEDYIVMEQGSAYQGTPGQADYQIAEFSHFKVRLPHPKISGLGSDIRTIDTLQLLPFINSDRKKIAELQWRISMPLMVLTLTLWAVPLSRVNPRGGKYAKLLPAIVLYFIYANFMFMSRNWLITGKLPAWLGMWWLHFTVFILGLLFLRRNRAQLL